MKLPATVQEIADVIGRERALFLIGQLPVCQVQDKRYKAATSRRVILYVPKVLRLDHPLVTILGFKDAERLVHAFGGEILCPPLMRDAVYRPFRDQAIARIHGQGVPIGVLADWFSMTERRVRQVLDGVREEIPQEGMPQAENDNARTVQQRAVK